MRPTYRTVLFLTLNGALFSQAVFADLTLEEIVVTAQKREQLLQEVPVAATAISGDMIAALGITRIEDISMLSPSLNASAGVKSTQAGLSIRGIGNYLSFGVQVEPAVLVVFDDVSQVQSGQAFSTMIDVERIEVLRGPQNTLFGKNASAGVVNIVSKAPSESFEASTEVTLTDDDEQAISGTVSGPLADTLGARVTAYYSDLDGYIENIDGGADLHDRETKAFRGKLLWQPSDELDLTLSANYMDSDETCCSMVFQSWDPTSAFLADGNVLLSDMLPGLAPDEQNDKTGRDDGDHQESDNSGVSLKADYQAGEHTLTSISAYNEWNNRAGNDIDFSGRDEPGDLFGAFSVRTWDDADRTSEFVSQELRLVSPGGERLEYLLGLYYSKTENSQRFQRFNGFAPLTADTNEATETEGYAAFGQADWHWSELTTLGLGLRYNYEEISADVQDFSARTRVNGNDADGVWLGKLALQHQVLEDTMGYASVATGYKGQAFDTTPFDENKAHNPVQPEESINYELGVKSIFFERRVQMDTAVFYTNYDDFQAQDFRAKDDGTADVRLLNVGKLQTYGVELDSAVLVTDNLRLGVNAAYTHAEVTEWDNAPCYPQQTVAQGCDTPSPVDPSLLVQGSAKGNTLPSAPRWKYTLNGDYQLPLGGRPFDFFTNINYVWQDDVNYDIKGSPYAVQDAYGIANLNVGIVENTAARWRVTAFVNNVFDEFYSGQVTDLLSGTLFTGQVVARIPVRSERYAGLRLNYSW